VLEDAGELGGDLGLGEALERDPLDAGAALELGQQGAQRVAAVQLVGAVGDDEAQRLGVALRTRKVRKSRVEESAQWASSSTSATGPRWPSRSMNDSSASNRRAWWPPSRSATASPAPSASSGSSSASAARVWGLSSGNSVRHSARSRAIGRSASTSGA
jgi:hypothetical protein